MKRCKSIGLLLILIPALGLAQQKTKKHNEVSAAFQNAHFVYVESVDGDAMKPGLFPVDHQAIFDVQDAVRDWNRYALAYRREQADLVFVVRKGRIASAQTFPGVPAGTRLPGGQTQGRAPGQAGGQAEDPDGVGKEAEVGPENDMLRVYLVSSDGKLSGPLWTREIKDGLDAPQLVLFQQLRTAVERAYPSQPPGKQPTP